jgi:hypothetical protein
MYLFEGKLDVARRIDLFIAMFRLLLFVLYNKSLYNRIEISPPCTGPVHSLVGPLNICNPTSLQVLTSSTFASFIPFAILSGLHTDSSLGGHCALHL